MSLDDKIMTPPADRLTQPAAPLTQVSIKRRKTAAPASLAVLRVAGAASALPGQPAASKAKASKRSRKKTIELEMAGTNGGATAPVEPRAVAVRAPESFRSALLSAAAPAPAAAPIPAAPELFPAVTTDIPAAAPAPQPAAAVPVVAETRKPDPRVEPELPLAAPETATAVANPLIADEPEADEPTDDDGVVMKSSVFLVATVRVPGQDADADSETETEAAKSAPMTNGSGPGHASTPETPAVKLPVAEPKAPTMAAEPTSEPVAAPIREISLRKIIQSQAEAAPKPVEQPSAPAEERPTPVADERPATPSRSEMIARAARSAALNANRSGAALQAVRSAQQQKAEIVKQPSTDLYGCWLRAKNGRRFPSRADLDAEQLAENWPNSMLLTCATGSSLGGDSGRFSQVARLGDVRRAPGEEINFSTMITEWMLAIGGEAARVGQPVQDTEVFPSPDGTHAYRIVALPLGDQQSQVDHVLCHLTRS